MSDSAIMAARVATLSSLLAWTLRRPAPAPPAAGDVGRADGVIGGSGRRRRNHPNSLISHVLR
ncbi:hypothetical protein NX02_22160 [Sphingomonas sanxanigenens DSM 19645 = NX02]|uniref:Uncharacterized protein n=1 Tax=Sphingomonas sanxanigenens DSM 19645 = NX02 TaxID=1123269 RepID=W0AHQ6_9SPHN|nr:hypothetical protein NX02_22160 [Sphingomonas sanxanigenens DSM 19645 = NX02]